ncbi:unnamed protein product [Enterobius vermicularis]|uniref:Ion channel n=1 Tax=Enterobius vermicularis TaxID=51028 RepID=A0A0N4V3I2_ENTVE|nr:unnamed protein product [Enterobius vermicularis]
MAGAWLFLSLESPNEDKLRKLGRSRIEKTRKEFIDNMSIDQWIANVDIELQKFNQHLYVAFKEQYVRYIFFLTFFFLFFWLKLKSQTKGAKKLWTSSSALFFAATTMATIGYGNIVPVTTYGRITCVIFSLVGAPLAIITIGDLGKFLSECTIWLYRKMKKGRGLFQYIYHKCFVVIVFVLFEATGPLNLDDLVMDKAEVPVILVFTILLLYIAFGGILFCVLESWSYMDAFYYCFVSLTTIGFGDLVPERHEYIVLMLVYLGVGLAVTTMCIDLVGIQYIQKIHYFGRKFRGADLLNLLKRKRMIEKHFAMGRGEEILQIYLQLNILFAYADLSFHCSLSTSPSVYEREDIYANFKSPEPSPVGLACMYEWNSYIQMLEDYSKPYVKLAIYFSVYPSRPESVAESDQTGSSKFEIDLGAFELVDSNISAEALLSQQEPVLFHQNIPVHSIHHDTVQTETALETIMTAPDSMLAGIVPPPMVDDNYCFIVDGRKVPISEIMKDQQWWQHTSRPTKYYYSEDMRTFQRVNCIAAKGRIISAKITSTVPSGLLSMHSSSTFSSPRSSISLPNARGVPRGESVPLYNVYKVIRYYSFWRSCKGFHRIVTVIDRINNDDPNRNPLFKKRYFVQYIWRKVKPIEKAKVRQDYEMRKPRVQKS